MVVVDTAVVGEVHLCMLDAAAVASAAVGKAVQGRRLHEDFGVVLVLVDNLGAVVAVAFEADNPPFALGPEA